MNIKAAKTALKFTVYIIAAWAALMGFCLALALIAVYVNPFAAILAGGFAFAFIIFSVVYFLEAHG